MKCRLISSIGAVWARPPPVAPPLTPKHGPSDGSRRQIIVRVPAAFNASPNPIVVVVLPSPAGVGLMPLTSTNLPARAGTAASIPAPIFALNLP